MRTLDKKIAMGFGKIFLVGALALTASGVLAADDCQTPQHLIDLRDKVDPDQNCAKNKGVPANVEKATGKDPGACEGVYKAGIDALDDYIRKTREGCTKVKEIKALNSCNGTSDQVQCQKKLGKLGTDLAKVEDEKAKAAEGLVKWIKEKKEAAKAAKEALASSEQKIGAQAKKEAANANSADAPPKTPYAETAKVRAKGVAVPASYVADAVSGVSQEINELKKEQDDAIKYGEEAAQTLTAESKKSAAAAKELTRIGNTANGNESKLGSVPSSGGSNPAKSEQAASGGSGSGSGGGAGGGGAPSIPSIPGGDKGGDSGASNPTADAASPTTGDLSPNSVANKTDGSGKSTDMKLDATPGKSATGDLSPGASGEILSGTGSSKMNTSLRDALKKKILGDAAEGGGSEALGGLGFGGNSAEAKKAGAPGAAGAAAGGGFSVPGFSDSGGAGGGGGGDDFSMSRSETEAAVHNLLNEFGTPGGNSADGRAIASSSSDAEAGIEGVEGTSLIHRVHDAIVRRLKNGSVANGVNGKI